MLVNNTSEPCDRQFHAFELINASGVLNSFGPCKVMHVAAWLRHAAHHTARSLHLDQDFIESYVCGHGKSSEQKACRLSYLPLPSIGHHFADGRIRRALIIEPHGAAHPGAQIVIGAIPGAILIDEIGQKKAALRATHKESDALRCYLRPSTTWGSVTPVVLPGFDEKKEKKAIGLVAKALLQAGYTTPVEKISVQQEPIFSGSEMADQYFVPSYQERWPRVHSIIKFAEPISGPLAIGTGRHLGLGVFASLI